MRGHGKRLGVALALASAVASPLSAQTPTTAVLAPTAGAPSTLGEPIDATPSAEQLHAQGVSSLQAHQNEAAVQSLRRAVALAPDSALYVTDLGYALLRQRRFVDAESAFRKGIELLPTRPHAYEHLVQAVVQQPERWGKRQELLQILERGLLANPHSDARPRLELARIRAERSYGLLERALLHIETLLSQRELPHTLAKQARELKAGIEQDKKAQALRDWPEPTVDAHSRERLSECEQRTDAERRKQALPILLELIDRYPAWRAPRSLRATILVEQRHYDEAVKEFTVLARLTPSKAEYHRELGQLLADHGGWLELERADAELRVALALEPEWQELAAIRQRLAARRYEGSARRPKPATSSLGPSDNAVRLYDEAEGELSESPKDPETATQLLERALRESPGYVEAAAMLYSLDRRMPETTVQALWQDASGMFALHQEFARVSPPAPAAWLDGWLDRAIELGHVEARLSRALVRKARGDAPAAELELANYLAQLSNPSEVEAIQRLRSELVERRPKPDPTRDIVLSARLLLQKEDFTAALKALEAPCRLGMDPERLLAIGMAYERMNQDADALDCYELHLENRTDAPLYRPIAERAARLLARTARLLFNHPAAAHLPQLAPLEPAAHWAMARRAAAAGNVDQALELAMNYLTQARSNDRFVADAKSLEAQIRSKEELRRKQLRERHRLWYTLSSSLLGLAGLCVYLALFRGTTLARAIRQRPRVFPDIARIIGELRHDVLKHRTSALELLKHDERAVDKIRCTLLEPVPTSTVVREAYARMMARARAEGVSLRRLEREPTFGPFARDLGRVERILKGRFESSALLKLDERLRGIHQQRLAQLLTLGPSCRLDASEIQRWIATLEAESHATKPHWTVPALEMSDPSLRFPIHHAALFQIFANLLRNAEAIVSELDNPRILVSLRRSIDFSGQPRVQLRIFDNAAQALTREALVSQDPGRGLGIVRDTARDWSARVLIEPEHLPYQKSVGIEFSS